MFLSRPQNMQNSVKNSIIQNASSIKNDLNSEELYEIAYRDELDVDDRTIDSHIKRIRKKFRKIDSEFKSINTLYGSGYKWK